MSTNNPVTDAVAKLEAFFVTKEQELIQFADKFVPAAESAVETGIEDIIELAGAAVLEEAPKEISGEEKFGNAVTNVVQKVEAGALGEGKTVLLAIAQAGVQIAHDTAAQKAAALTASASGASPSTS